MKQGQCTISHCKYYREIEVGENTAGEPVDVRGIKSTADRLLITNRCVYCTNYVGFRLFVEGEEFADRKET